jgi:Zn-dependent peptidase ImmA (M78 family)
MDKHHIETQARELFGEVLKHESTIFNDGLPRDRFDLLVPEAAAAVCGVSLHRAGKLDAYTDAEGRSFRTAGLLIPSQRLIYASRDFDPVVQDFTAMHEIGHLLLHKMVQPHRDRPLGKIDDSYVRDPEEREADYFAAAYRIPRRLLREHFAFRFGEPPFVFTEAMAHLLAPNDHLSLLRPHKGSATRAAALAGCRTFNGKHFSSLADRFRVSIPVMAYRLEDVSLVRDWP